MLWIDTEWPILFYNLRMSQRTGVDWASIIQFSLTVFLKYTVPKYRTIIRSALLFVMNTTWTCISQSDDVFHNDDDDDHHHKYRRWRNSPLIYELFYNIYWFQTLSMHLTPVYTRNNTKIETFSLLPNTATCPIILSRRYSDIHFVLI